MVNRILIVHNRYQRAGGEDRVVEAEAELLRKHGHEVFLYIDDNDRIDEIPKWKTAIQTIWSNESFRKLSSVIRENRIELCHFHNTFPLISPAAYYAAQRASVPVVQTLHNYRLICPGSLLMREGRICETCVGRTFVWPGIAHRCYRDSYAASTVTAAAITAHNLSGTWSRQVDRYIALGEFGRRKFIEGGLPAAKIEVKPNFLEPDPGCGDGRGGYALFVGRLSPEKGITTLLEAWDSRPEFPDLYIAGGGPLAGAVQEACSRNVRVKWLGEISRAEILERMRGAGFLICASTWYECFPLVIVEAFASGLPVIASNLGALAELIDPGKTGLLFEPGCAEDLSAQVHWALAHQESLRRMRSNVRSEYEQRYTGRTNYQILSTIYDRLQNESVCTVRRHPVRRRIEAAARLD